MAGLSSPGIGSNLDINGIVSKLMQAESQPLMALAKKEASYQAKLSAFGSLSGALSSFQSALSSLNSQSTFQSMMAAPSDASIFSASASSSATAASYSINVARLAQSQTLSSAGKASTTATIGTGTTTKLTFQFGTVSGNFAGTGGTLSAAVAASGIAANSLSINGTTITTSGPTNSANALASQINLATATTGVTATAQTTDTGVLGGFTTTTGVGYTLDVGGVNIISNAANGTDAAALDAAVALAAGSLTTAGVSFTGTAAAGTLKFTKADGSNIAVQESGAATGGFASIGVGSTKTFTGAVSLSSASAITIAGSNPTAAGFSAGTISTYSGASFTQDSNRASGLVTIDNTNNSLQGIRDAINKANIGVTASIVSDGSANPYHLVIKSNQTGAASSMKISVQGTDPDLTTFNNLVGYDPAGTQNMTQTAAAQSAQLDINGIAVSSQTNTVSSAVEGVSLTLSKIGSSNLNITRNTSAVQSGVAAMVKAYNDVNATIRNVSAYSANSAQSGPLIGDSSVRNIQAQLRKMLSTALTGSDSSLKTLGQVGISINKEGVMSLDSSKLSTAMNNNMNDVVALFSSIGTSSDSLVSYVSSTSSTTPGAHPISVTSLATQGKVVGSQDLTGGITIDSSNKDLDVTIDGVSASVSLIPSAIAYTSAEIAAQVQSAINGASALSSAGIAVSVTIDGSGKMNITSGKFGSVSKVIVGGTGGTALLGATPVTTDGADVVGTIDGVAGGGSGKFLTGASGSPAAGLKLEITGGAAPAARGTVTFSQGYAFHLSKLLEGFLGDSGTLSARTKGINNSIKDLGKQNEIMNKRLADTEKRYRAQFTALDVTIGKMTSTSSYLTQQLAQISNLSKSS
jgi:flagellar hook-associated protein 2